MDVDGENLSGFNENEEWDLLAWLEEDDDDNDEEFDTGRTCLIRRTLNFRTRKMYVGVVKQTVYYYREYNISY